MYELWRTAQFTKFLTTELVSPLVPSSALYYNILNILLSNTVNQIYLVRSGCKLYRQECKRKLKTAVSCILVFWLYRGEENNNILNGVGEFLLGAPNKAPATETLPLLYELRRVPTRGNVYDLYESGRCAPYVTSKRQLLCLQQNYRSGNYENLPLTITSR